MSLRKIILLVIAVGVIFLLGGCAKEKGKPKESSKKIPPIPKPEEAVAAAFTASSPPKSLMENDPGRKKKYSLEEGQFFSGNYVLANQSSSKSYGLLALLDYKQIPFTVEGKELFYHKLNISPYQEKSYPFKTNPLTKGFHDYAMILIWEPDNHSLDPDFRLATDTRMISFQRANLMVGSTEPRVISFNAEGEREKPKDLPIDGIAVNKKAKGELEMWLKEEAKPKEVINYFIHMGNKDTPPRTFALIAFLDYKQISLNPQGPLVIFGKVDPGEMFTIPGSLIVPEKKGLHELFFLWIASPFTKLPESPPRKKNYIDDRIEPSVRIPIIVH